MWTNIALIVVAYFFILRPIIKTVEDVAEMKLKIDDLHEWSGGRERSIAEAEME